MNNRHSTYASIALAVAGLALLATFGIWFVLRDFTLPIQISLALVVIGVALFVYFDPDRARALFSARQTRYGSNILIMFLAFLGVLVMVNWIVYDNAQDWGLRWDLTEDKERTLTPETIKALESLEAPVTVRAYYTANHAGRQRARDLLEDYQFYANGNLVYEMIDPNEDPLGVQQAGVTQDGTVVFSYGENEERVTAISELEYTNAILRVLNPGNRGVYFLTGHGEYSVEATGEESLSRLNRALGDKKYEVHSLNLLTDPTIPEDAVVIVIAGPLQPVTQAEMDLIAAFVDAGGALVVAEEPVPLTDFGEAEDPVAAYLLDNWGIQLGEDLVVDMQSMQAFNSPFFAIASQYGNSPITADLLQRGLVSIFPLARSVQVVEEGPEGVTHTELVLTTDQAWAEGDYASIEDGSLAPDETDRIGPVPVAVSAQHADTGARVVVFGDSDFMADGSYDQFGNSDLILNTVDWVASQENLISLTPRSTTQRFIVPPQASTINLIALGTVCVIPGLVLISGISVWVSRRRRG